MSTDRKKQKTKKAYSSNVRLLIAGILWALLPAASIADSLLDIYTLALENDAEYRGALSANLADHELRPQALASLLPTMEFSGTFTSNREDVRKSSSNYTQAEGSFGYPAKQLRLSITQPVFRRDLWIALDQAKDRVEQADFTLFLARQALMIRVADRYLSMLRTLDDLTFARSEKKAAEQQLHQVQLRFDVGFIPITDIEETKAARDLAVAREIEAQNQVDNAREALWEVTAQYVTEPVPMDGEVELKSSLEPDNIDRWTETALKQNLEVAVARQAMEIAESEIKRIGAGHLPTVDLVGAHDRNLRNSSSTGESDIRTSSLSIQLNIPIFQGGMVLSRSREAMHRHTQTAEELDRIRRGVQRQTRNAFLGIVSGASRIKALQQALQSTETALDATRAGFEAGTRTSVEVLDAERDMLRAKRDHASARYDYVLDMLRLKQAAGTLSDNDIVTINAWFGEPESEDGESEDGESEDGESEDGESEDGPDGGSMARAEKDRSVTASLKLAPPASSVDPS